MSPPGGEPAVSVRLTRHGWASVVAVALGGTLGASGRYGLTLWLPGRESGFPYGTLLTNGLGCAAIGVLMVTLTEGRLRVVSGSVAPLLRPFLGVGLLGGFTSFSAYAADTVGLWEDAAYWAVLAYGLGTVVISLLAVAAGVAVARRVRRSRGLRRAGSAGCGR